MCEEFEAVQYDCVQQESNVDAKRADVYGIDGQRMKEHARHALIAADGLRQMKVGGDLRGCELPRSPPFNPHLEPKVLPQVFGDQNALRQTKISWNEDDEVSLSTLSK